MCNEYTKAMQQANKLLKNISVFALTDGTKIYEDKKIWLNRKQLRACNNTICFTVQ